MFQKLMALIILQNPSYAGFSLFEFKSVTASQIANGTIAVDYSTDSIFICDEMFLTGIYDLALVLFKAIEISIAVSPVVNLIPIKGLWSDMFDENIANMAKRQFEQFFHQKRNLRLMNFFLLILNFKFY